MTKYSSIFRTVRELIENRDEVLLSNAINIEGGLYDDSVKNLHALDMLEPSLIGLIEDCRAAGLQSKALDEVAELIRFDA